MPISVASNRDIPALVAMVNSAFRGDSARRGWTHEADLLQGGVRIQADMLREQMAAEGTTVLQYHDDEDRLCACVLLQLKPRGLYLGMLTVDPMQQGLGIGKQLLAAAEMFARARGCACVYMSVIADRTELIDWYLRHGYHPTGERIPFEPEPEFGIPSKPLSFTVLEKPIIPSPE